MLRCKECPKTRYDCKTFAVMAVNNSGCCIDEDNVGIALVYDTGYA